MNSWTVLTTNVYTQSYEIGSCWIVWSVQLFKLRLIYDIISQKNRNTSFDIPVMVGDFFR